ncbi:hypothetical protein NUH87_26565 [Pseudomonas batumici]
MTPFEKGYKAFLDRISEDGNPFPKNLWPHSHQRWNKGWMRAKQEGLKQ